MEEITISKFKATCPAVLERVRRTRKPVLITRFGEPVAEVGPPSPARRPERWLGALKASAQIKDDLAAPVVEEADYRERARRRSGGPVSRVRIQSRRSRAPSRS